MRGLEKTRMERGQTTSNNIKRTSQLYDRIGPVGRFDERRSKKMRLHNFGKIAKPFTINMPHRALETQDEQIYKTQNLALYNFFHFESKLHTLAMVKVL